jgi:hypothetical protein
VISLQNFRQQLDFISTHLLEDQHIPNFDSLLDLYGLTTVNPIITDENIIFHLKVPLISSEKFILYREVAVPYIHQDQMYWIKPNAEYSAINLEKGQIYLLNSEAVQNCKQIKQRYFCFQINPIFNNASKRIACELGLLHQEEKLSESCNIHSTKSENVWIALQNSSWIFVIPHKLSINVSCEPHDSYSVELIGSGFLQILGSCKIVERTSYLSGLRTFQSNSISNIMPSRILHADFNAFSTHLPILQKASFGEDERVIDTDVAILQQKVDQITSKQWLPYELNGHDLHHYIFNHYFYCFVLF